ncbi:MAG: SDR family NAD(P)-dependent oxidoreductase [Alphaproteobacteria bacterium]|nr:SDR family NAD(P)-dependent oxidoreductase [Alphaproteobacteria bacterium]
MPTVFLTGANRGIGLGFAKVYLDAGWQVIAAVRNPDAAGDLKALGVDHGDRLSIHKVDLADSNSIDALATELKGTTIDILLGNAAKTDNPMDEFGSTNYDAWAEAFQVNCMGQMKMAEAFVEHVAASDQKKMFFVSSRIGAKPPAGLILFRTSKSALNQVVMQLSLILGPRGIAVACGHPGFVKSKSTLDMGVFEAEESAGYLKKIIDDLTVETAGQFFDPDGSTLPIVTRQMNPTAFGAKAPDAWDDQAKKREDGNAT